MPAPSARTHCSNRLLGTNDNSVYFEVVTTFAAKALASLQGREAERNPAASSPSPMERSASEADAARIGSVISREEDRERELELDSCLRNSRPPPLMQLDTDELASSHVYHTVEKPYSRFEIGASRTSDPPTTRIALARSGAEPI